MQSVQTSTLEKQIEQLFLECITVWRDSDTKKIQAVKMLAGRMEELYLSQGRQDMVCTISATITRRLESAGIKSAKHVHDFLDDPKYKQMDKDHSESRTIYGANVDNNVLVELEHKAKINPLDLEAEEKRQVRDLLIRRQEQDERLQKAIEEAAAQQKQALDYNTDTFTSSTDKKYNPVHTPIPDNKYRGSVYQEIALFVDDLYKYYVDMRETLDDVGRWYDREKVPEEPFVKAIQQLRGYIKDVRRIIAPAKDLKFATSMHNWFHTLLKFLSHGKHAAAVMTSIPSPIHFKTLPDGTKVAIKRPLTREQVGDIEPEIEDLLERYGESKEFMSHITTFLKDNDEWDNNWQVRQLRTELAVKLIGYNISDADFLAHIKAYFRENREWSRDDQILKWRREFNEKLVREFADDGDFYDHLSSFREKTMDESVAGRRIEAHETLSGLA